MTNREIKKILIRLENRSWYSYVDSVHDGKTYRYINEYKRVVMLEDVEAIIKKLIKKQTDETSQGNKD